MQLQKHSEHACGLLSFDASLCNEHCTHAPSQVPEPSHGAAAGFQLDCSFHISCLASPWFWWNIAHTAGIFSVHAADILNKCLHKHFDCAGGAIHLAAHKRCCAEGLAPQDSARHLL